MIWYSPELDEFVLILLNITNDGTSTYTQYTFILDKESNEEKVMSNAWFYIGEI